MIVVAVPAAIREIPRITAGNYRIKSTFCACARYALSYDQPASPPFSGIITVRSLPGTGKCAIECIQKALT